MEQNLEKILLNLQTLNKNEAKLIEYYYKKNYTTQKIIDTIKLIRELSKNISEDKTDINISEILPEEVKILINPTSVYKTVNLLLDSKNSEYISPGFFKWNFVNTQTVKQGEVYCIPLQNIKSIKLSTSNFYPYMALSYSPATPQGYTFPYTDINTNLWNPNYNIFIKISELSTQSYILNTTQNDILRYHFFYQIYRKFLLRDSSIIYDASSLQLLNDYDYSTFEFSPLYEFLTSITLSFYTPFKQIFLNDGIAKVNIQYVSSTLVTLTYVSGSTLLFFPYYDYNKVYFLDVTSTNPNDSEKINFINSSNGWFFNNSLQCNQVLSTTIPVLNISSADNISNFDILGTFNNPVSIYANNYRFIFQCEIIYK